MYYFTQNSVEPVMLKKCSRMKHLETYLFATEHDIDDLLKTPFIFPYSENL